MTRNSSLDHLSVLGLDEPVVVGVTTLDLGLGGASHGTARTCSCRRSRSHTIKGNGRGGAGVTSSHHLVLEFLTSLGEIGNLGNLGGQTQAVRSGNLLCEEKEARCQNTTSNRYEKVRGSHRRSRAHQKGCLSHIHHSRNESKH